MMNRTDVGLTRRELEVGSGRSRGLLAAMCALLTSTASAQVTSVVLYDFEADTAGWEHEAAQPAALRCVEEAWQGEHALGVTYDFTPETDTLQLRVKTADRPDFNSIRGFSGFSAWVYLPRNGQWTVRMFVRSGPQWTWTAGDPVEPRHRGWVQVGIPGERIFRVGEVQDLGIQVTLQRQSLSATICLDQVEAMLEPSPPFPVEVP